MNVESPRHTAEAPARPRELWPAATLGTMMLLIVVLAIHLVTVSVRLGPAEPGLAETYADGAGPATAIAFRFASGSE